jgi:pilus assembly protein FimV
MVRRALIFLCLLLSPLHAVALGLGDIRVDSALNEPLDARIELLSLDPGEAQDIRVLLADQEAFRKAGLDRPYLLNSLRFKVGVDDRGQGFIRVTTRTNVKEPYLNFLLEVNWRGGVLQREYALLLDPPTYRVAPAPSQEVSPPTEAAAPVTQKQPGLYHVRASDTLWVIAEKVRPQPSHSVEQVMMALQRRNPEAFLENNVNRLKSGAILEVPDSAEVERMGSGAAQREFQRQTQVWEQQQAQPQQLAEQGVTEQPSQQQASSEAQPAATQTEVEEQPQLKILEPVDREAVELALSSTEGGPDQQMQRLRTAIEASKQELESVREINRELDQLRATLETEIGALRQALQERDAVIDELIKRMEQEDAAAAALEQSEAGSDLLYPPTPEQEPGGIDSSLAASASLNQQQTDDEGSNFWVTGISMVVIAVMALVAFYLWWGLRRGHGGKEESVLYSRVELPEVAIRKESYDSLYRKLKQQELEEGAQLSAKQDQQLPDEETEVLLTDEFLDEETEDPDEVSPGTAETQEKPAEPKIDVGAILTEADVYLIYRQYGKAESLVQGCLESHPQVAELQAKLLEIYASQKAKGQFVAYLEQVADSLKSADPDIWRRVEDLGLMLVPEHPLFNLGGAVLTEDQILEADQPPPDKPADTPATGEQLSDSEILDSFGLELDLDDDDRGGGR